MNSAVTYPNICADERKKCHDSSWDYKEFNTKIVSHGVHTYPAMMIPQVARRLIETYGENAEVLLDPFMGSGTSLVEAKIHPQFKEAYGIDINPLARLIGKVKSTPISTKILNEEAYRLIEKCQNDIFALNLGQKTLEPVSFKNIEFWFKPAVIRDLTVIKQHIDEIEDADVRDFFNAAFSEVVRNVSNTKNSEFKLYRMSGTKLEKHNPNTIKVFEKRVFYNILQISNLNDEAKDCKVHILNEDTRKETSLKSNSVDIIVSSPPYGDSHTTVAYGQFSRLSLEFLGYDDDEVRKIDKVSLGGVKASDFSVELNSSTLMSEIAEIAEIDKKRAFEVISFYKDFVKCIKEIDRVMKADGYVCLVVGNRTVKNVKLSTDVIIAELFTSLGNYEHERTIIRNIPSKRMPKANSPTNVKGSTVPTMNEEYIVILKKLF
ncbi:MAG TPA: DNA methyltransferase [Methanocorpusculum sp.]|nr:DNA methyltransferase [Methanocorpusculum sp.]